MGSYSKTWGSPNSPSTLYRVRNWSTQAKPYVAPLPFEFKEGREVLFRNPNNISGLGPAAYLVSFNSAPGSAPSQVLNRCKDKLYGKLGEESQWIVNFLERKQAISMIAQRAGQLLKAARAIRKGRFGKAAKVLGVVTPKGVSRKRQFSNNWLEYHFGWVPMIQDIGAAVHTLQSPVPDRHIFASSKGRFSADTGYWPSTLPPYGGTSTHEVYELSARTGVTVRISNPDLFLANQLGFTNPLAVAWEVVPFSFVVDWLIPIGDFLSAMTATLGLTLVNGYTSLGCRHSVDQYSSTYVWNGVKDVLTQVRRAGLGWWTSRTLGALSAYPSLRPTIGLSPIRALTSVTLLIQQLRK
jgi:hypothetical protein